MRKNNTLRIKLNRLLVVTIICTILVQNIVPGLSVFASESISGGEMEISTTPEENETPETSTTQEESTTPEVSEIPEESETPEESTTPEVSETPEKSTTPEVSQTPEESTTPEVSQTPEVSSTPEVSETPEVSSTPEVSETPEISKAPELSLDMPLGSFAPSNSMMLGSTNEITSDAEEINDLTFDPNTQTITACVDNPAKDLVIPAQIDGVEVLHIGDKVLSARRLNSITFEEGSKLQSIGEEAFYNNPSITSVELPNTVTSIGASAFQKCEALTSINIPEGVTTIAEFTFSNCTNLKQITLPTSLKTIGASAFASTGLTSISFLEGLTSIGANAFSYCNITSETTLPNSVTTIGTGAFSNNGFSIFHFGTGSKVIPSNIFLGCSSLEKIYLPNTEDSYMYTSYLGNYGARIYGDTVVVDEDFLFKGDEPTLKGYIGTGGIVNIPESFTGISGKSITVTGIANKVFYQNNNITEVILPSGLEEIGESAFYNCTQLTTVKFASASHLKNICGYAFKNCDKLTELDFTGVTNLETIQGQAFYDCDGVKTIDFANLEKLQSIGYEAFRSCSELASVNVEGVINLTTIGDYAFYYNTKIEVFDFSQLTSLESIGHDAFAYCNALEEVEIGELSKLASIGYNAFKSCGSIEAVTLPAGITTVNISLFQNCSALKTITFKGNITNINSNVISGTAITTLKLPSTITWIASSAFTDANKLTKIEIEKPENSVSYAPWGSTTASIMWSDTLEIGGYIYSTTNKQLQKYVGMETVITIPTSLVGKDGISYEIESLGEALFAATQVTNVTIPNKYTTLPSKLFYNCDALTSVSLPENLTSLGAYTFYDCGALTSISLPENLTSLGQYTFYNCGALTSIDLSKLVSLKIIPSYAFNNCSNLKKVVLPITIEDIQTKAFYYCTQLNEINAPASIKKIGDEAFRSCGFTDFSISPNIETIGSSAFKYSNLAGTIVLAESLTSLGDFAFAETDIVSITFPDSISTIPKECVGSCSELKEVKMGDNVTSIQSRAFYNCKKLTDIHLSEKLQSISSGLFCECTALESLKIPESVTSISGDSWVGHQAFYKCTSLTNLTLPEGLTSIGEKAFNNAGIIQLQIPSTVTSMNIAALSGMSQLESLFINQDRNTRDFHVDASWGASASIVPYFKGEAVVIEATITPVEGQYLYKIELITEAEDNLVVKSITYPEGLCNEDGTPFTTKSENIGTSTWSKTIYANKDGEYTFEAESSKGIKSSFIFKVEGIGLPEITSSSAYSITPSLKDSIAAEQLIEKLGATATDGVKDLTIAISSEDIDKIKGLTKENPTVAITLEAVSAHENKKVTKVVNITYLTIADITIVDQDGKTILNDTYDIETKIIVKNSGNDQTTNTYIVGEGRQVTLPIPYTKTGYTFHQWMVEKKDGEIVAVISPTYTINRYEVEFNSTGGSYISPQIYEYNTTAQKPAVDPSRSGYSFEGWYTNTDYTNEYNFDNKITDDITVYAKWEHVHDIVYTSSGNEIIATCHEQNADCQYCDDNYIAGTATLVSPISLVAEDGDKEFTIDYSDKWKLNLNLTLDLEYLKSNALLTEAPTTRGNYMVKVLVGNETVLTKDYEITNAIIQPETVFENYATVSSAWTNTQITFEQSESNYTFCTSENGTYTDTISFADLNDGTETKQVYVKNNEDGVIYLTTLTYKLENTAPTFTMSGQPTTWQKADVILTVSASDLGGSGLASEPYSYNNGTTWVADDNCTYTENEEIEIWVKDAAGNITKQTIATLLVDQTTPDNITVTLDSAAPTGSNGWYKDKVGIHLELPTSSDKEAPITSYYKLWKNTENEPSVWTEVTDNLTLTVEDGNWNLKTYTIDEANNASAESAVITWKQDTTKPVINGLDFDTTKTFLDWILGRSSVEVTVKVEDVLSGTQTVVATMTGVDGSANSVKTLEVTNDKATLTISANWKGTISFEVVDEAGLVSDAYTIEQIGHDGIMVENIKPEITVSEPTPNEDDWYKEDVTIVVEATDEGLSSGLESVTYQINSETPVTVTTGLDTSFVAQDNFDIVFEEDGEYVVVISAKDHAGNEADTVTTSTIKLDKTAPAIGVDYKDDTWTNEDYMYIDFGVSDTGSGIDQIKVYKGQEEYQVTDSNGGKTFRVEENGSYTIEVTDVAGNVETEVVAVTKFDRITPDIEWTAQTQLLSTSDWYGKNQLINQIIAIESVTTENEGAPIGITYVIDEGAASETVDVASLTTGTHTMKAVITDEAGNEAEITRIIKIDNIIDEFNANMVGVNTDTGIDIIAEIKNKFDNYTQVQVARILTNVEAKANYDTLLDLYKAYEETIALQQKILTMEQVINDAYESKDHWVNTTAMALYEKLTEEEIILINADVVAKCEEIKEDCKTIDALIAKINNIAKTSDESYVQTIEELASEVDTLVTNTGTKLPEESNKLLETLVTYKANAVNVSNMPLTTLEEARAAKVAYEALSTYEKGMVDGKAIDTAYDLLFAALEAEQKAKEQFIVLIEEIDQYPTATGMEQLQASFDKLSESVKEQLTAVENTTYENLVNAYTQDVIDIIDSFDKLDITNRESIEEVLGQYNKITDDIEKKIINNSVSVDIEILKSELADVVNLEARVGKIDETNLLENQAEIEAVKKECLLLSKDALALVSQEVIEKIDRLYTALLKELEYNNSAETSNSSVVIIGLAENVALPESSKDMDKTTISVIMNESIPEVVPEVDEKDLMSSADIKLLCTLEDENGNTYEQYVQPKTGQSVVIKLEIQAGYQMNTLEIIHVKDNGKREMVPIKEIVQEDGKYYAIFEISSFSHFMVYASKIVIPPVTSNNNPSQLEDVVEEMLDEEIVDEEIVDALVEEVIIDNKEIESPVITEYDKVTENITPIIKNEENEDETAPEGTVQPEIQQEIESKESPVAGKYIGWGLLVTGLGSFFFFILWKRRRKQEDKEMKSDIKKILALFLIIGISFGAVGCDSLEEAAKQKVEQAAKEVARQAAQKMIEEISQSIEEDGINALLEEIKVEDIKGILENIDSEDLEEFKDKLEEMDISLEDIVN